MMCVLLFVLHVIMVRECEGDVNAVFVYGQYCKCKRVCVLLSDLDIYLHHPPLCGAAPTIQRVRMTVLPKKAIRAPLLGGLSSTVSMTCMDKKVYYTYAFGIEKIHKYSLQTSSVPK